MLVLIMSVHDNQVDDHTQHHAENRTACQQQTQLNTAILVVLARAISECAVLNHLDIRRTKDIKAVLIGASRVRSLR